MEFEEVKKIIIDMQRPLDINEYLWFYIKAQTFEEIILAVKNAENFKWNWEQGFYSEDILSLFPEESLTAQNVFYKKENLVFETTEETSIPSYIILVESTANITLSSLQKTKIVCISSTINELSLQDDSYINIELVGDSNIVNASLDEGCYAIFNYNNNSKSENVEVKGDSTLKVDGYENSNIKVKIADGFVNAYLQDSSSIILENGNDVNSVIQLLDMATKTII